MSLNFKVLRSPGQASIVFTRGPHEGKIMRLSPPFLADAVGELWDELQAAKAPPDQQPGPAADITAFPDSAPEPATQTTNRGKGKR